jgi:hypothetical protein
MMKWIFAKDDHPAYKGLILCYRGKGYPLFVGEWECGHGVIDMATGRSFDVIKYVVIDGLDE